MHRRTLTVLIGVLVELVAVVALAAPRDGTARKQIDEAIDKYYLATQFDKAESHLLGAISGCAGQCSGPVIAKAWMYVGIVRGGGKNDQKGAKEAFANALAADSHVALDAAMATEPTKKTFAAAQRAKRSGGASVDVGSGDDSDADDGAGAPLVCTPKLSEVETRRPVPISCTAGEGAKKAELQYKSGSGGWQRIKMKSHKGAFEATIPCTALAKKGKLRFFVRVRDEDGSPVGAYGKKAEPIEISVVRDTDEDPPAFPDHEPPRRCSRSQAEGAEECSTDDDCDSDASCQNGKCEQASGHAKAGPFKENWVGLHVAYDFAIVGGNEVCSRDSQANKGFACFYQGTDIQYRYNPQPNYNDNVITGVAPATYRALLSFEHLFTPNVSAGVRLGYAFGGGPPSGKNGEAKFLPFHAEARLSYWPGDAPFAHSGFRPFVGVQVGAAQVDAKLPVKVGDCGGTAGGAPSKLGDQSIKDPTFYANCSAGTQAGPRLDLDAYRRLGRGFGGIHGGVMYAPSADSGIVLNIDVMQFLPTSGQAIEPSLGYVFGL